MPTVLVIDDDLSALFDYRAGLARDGFDVRTETTARGGMLAARQQRFDVILVDLQLPDSNGLEVLRSQSSRPQGPAFVVITAFATVSSAVDAIKLGAFDYVSKPIRDTDLVRIVRAAMNAGPVTTSYSVSEAPGSDGITDRRVRECLRLVRDGYSRPGLNSRAVSKIIGLSHYFLIRLLKRETGKGFLHHLHAARVREAQRLLQTTSLSVKEIAVQVGYGSTTRLDHHFVRYCMMTPTEFRAALRTRH